MLGIKLVIPQPSVWWKIQYPQYNKKYLALNVFTLLTILSSGSLETLSLSKDP